MFIVPIQEVFSWGRDRVCAIDLQEECHVPLCALDALGSQTSQASRHIVVVVGSLRTKPGVIHIFLPTFVWSSVSSSYYWGNKEMKTSHLPIWEINKVLWKEIKDMSGSWSSSSFHLYLLVTWNHHGHREYNLWEAKNETQGSTILTGAGTKTAGVWHLEVFLKHLSTVKLWGKCCHVTNTTAKL